MKSQKACKACKTVFEEAKCPQCGSQEFSEHFKGAIIILQPDKSEIAKKININKSGIFAIRLG